VKIKAIRDALEANHVPLRRKLEEEITEDDKKEISKIISLNEICLRLESAGFTDTDEIKPIME
jgi:hypothetical protein